MRHKKFLPAFVLLILTSSASAQNWFKGNLEEAFGKAKTEGKKVLVDFYSGG